MSKTGELGQASRRGAMPICSAWIDELRAAFGAEGINDAQKRGMRGEPTFWAKEGGIEIGTREPEPRVAFNGHELMLALPALEKKGKR